MLRIRVSELSLPDRNRLGTELVMTLLSDFTYPPFMDYRAGELRTRPFSQADRQRAEEFVAGLGLEHQDTIEIASSALAEQLADLLVNYHRAVVPDRAQRHKTELHRQALQLGRHVQRRLVDYVLNGANNGFGLSVTPTSWSVGGSVAQPWEAIAPGTVSLATALATLREETTPPRPSAPPANPVPSQPLGGRRDGMPDMVTERLPIISRDQLPPSPPVVPPPAPEPEPARSPESLLTAPLPRSVDLPKTPAADSRGDQAIFMQLREQLLNAMNNAARNYGITQPPGDPAGLLAALRQRNAIEENDLRLAEGILALCGRVIAASRADIDDFREGLMLYLLFHRSRFAKR